MNRFGQKGCFICQSCKKRTRETGDNAGVELCPLCYSKATCGNGLSDNGYNGDAWAVFDKCNTVKECEALYDKEMEKLNG